MKKIVTFCLLVCWMTACGPAPEETIKYHETIITHKKTVENAFLKLEKTLEDTSWVNIEAELEVLNEVLHDEIYALKNQPSFDGKEDYKTLIQNYLLELKYIGDNEVKDYIEFMHTPEEEISEKDRKYFNKLKPLIREKYQTAEDHLRHGQDLFSEKYGITIE